MKVEVSGKVVWGVGSKMLGVGLADPLYLPASSYQYLQPVEQIGYNIRKSFWRSPPNTASETPGRPRLRWERRFPGHSPF